MEKTFTEEAEDIIASIDIPSQPQVIINIYKEVQKPEPNFRKLKELVSQDIAMAARVIKIANSSYFGLSSQVHSIEHALTVLGLLNFTNIIVTSSLRETLYQSQLDKDDFDVFFKHAMHTARISQFITNKARIFSSGIIFPSQTYMAGLFHDCGILILSKKYPDYFTVLKSALDNNESLIRVEESHFRTNHAVVGYVVAKSWKLPSLISQVILHHHNTNLVEHKDPSLGTMLAINMMAEKIIEDFHESIETGEKIYSLMLEDENHFSQIMNALNLDEDDYKDILTITDQMIEHS